MFFVPVAELIYATGEVLTFDLTGFYQAGDGVSTRVSNQYSILAFGILICMLNAIIILMYRRRVLQLRLCIYNILLLAGLVGVMMFVVYSVQGVDGVWFRLPVMFPGIAMILHFLAFRSIRKDELMVQALSRIR
jgi:hypothetical protein